MPLEPGTPVLACSEGRWWKAIVIKVEESGEVVLRYPGWEERWVGRVARRLLQVDPDPARRPITFPSDSLERWQKEQPSEDIKGADAGKVRRE
jgi:hypothetical protein